MKFMKRKFLTQLILFFSIFSMTTINAQVIILSCKTKLTKQFLDKHPEFWEEMCSKYGGEDCYRAKRANREVRKCEQSGFDYSHKRIFTFDKRTLNEKGETWVDMVNENCWGDNDNKRNIMTSTVSTLFFKDTDGSFNVDRATLLGGWRDDRTWQCDIKEQAIKNKI